MFSRFMAVPQTHLSDPIASHFTSHVKIVREKIYNYSLAAKEHEYEYVKFVSFSKINNFSEYVSPEEWNTII